MTSFAEGISMEEVFDVVNHKDQVIGSERRSIIHRDNLLHRAVHIFIFNQRADVFLQKRSMLKDIHPGLWTTSCCGHVDKGEAYEQAAYRELQEELGVTINRGLELLFKDTPHKDNTYEFINVYSLSHDGPFQLHPDEVSEGKWMNPEMLDEELKSSPQVYAPSLKRLWAELRGKSC